jgi:hypothetical protein
LKSRAVPAAGRQRREGAKNEREKEHVGAEVLKTFHQFGEFSFCRNFSKQLCGFATLHEAKSDFKTMSNIRQRIAFL